MGWIRQPFMACVAGLFLGAGAIQITGGPEWVAWPGAGVIVILCAVVARRHPRHLAVLGLLGFATSLFAGSWQGSFDTRWHPWPVELAESREAYEFSGRVQAPARIIRDRWSATIDVHAVDGRTVSMLGVRASGDLPAPRAGDEILGYARVTRPAPRDFPRLSDRRRRQESRGIALQASVVDWELIRRDASITDRVLQRLADRRVALQRRLLRVLGEQRGGIAVALTTGEKAYLTAKLDQAFADTGTGHVLAISGLHFGVIGGAIWWTVLGLVRRVPWLLVRFGDKRSAALVVELSLALFLLFVGAPVSAVRAWIAATFVIVSLVLVRPFCAFHALGWAAALLIWHDVKSVGDLGFQLSFAATFGILLFMRNRPSWLRPPPYTREAPRSRRIRAFVLSIGVSTAATLLTTPVILAHFGIVSVASFWTNLLVVPVVSIVLFPGLLFGIVLDTLGMPVAEAMMRWSMDVFVWMGGALDEVARWPGSVLVLGCPSVAATFVLLAATTGLLLRPGRAAGLALVSVIVGTAAMSTIGNRPPERLEAHILPVGQGDSILVRDAGLDILIDAGGRLHGPDPGRRIVVPYLRRLGVSHLDALVVTHDDLDHSGGASAVLELIPTGMLVTHAEDSRTARIARGLGVPVVSAQSRTVTLGRVTMTSMACETDNDRSVITRVGDELLLPGDIERCAEDALTAEFRLPTRALLAPHHGSTTSSSPRFIAATAPQLVVTSSGRHNRFRHPRPEILRRWRALASVFGTQKRGLIRLRFREETLDVRSVR